MGNRSCPECGSQIKSTERRIDGNSTCTKGHKHPTSRFVASKPLRIEAAQRLKADWFQDLGAEQQKQYVEQHPHSKHAENYDNARDAEPKDDNGDAERVKQLRSQIKMLVEDIADMKAEGEDYAQERKQLESLRGELASLS